ncbi:MAG: AAA family ATPase [Nocardioides sp.]|uniref:AAA family ATPase n=1 Tax=Nocardioides sp. TaxID=35761 RepID=UPI0039E3483E
MVDAGALMVSCASCAAELPARAKFCLECGSPVAAQQPREVRKTVTLLFTDVTGSTALGEAMDPEVFRALMGRYFEAARAAIARHGGTVEKFVGDAVLAVFGVPEVHEDDALRAARAAFELNQAVRELAADFARTHGVAFAIRTGVNTGSVVAGTGRAGGSFATGDAVNTAARLEQAAAPGEILLGEQTWQLVRDAVDAEPVAPVAAKGKAEPVPAYRLLDVREGHEGRDRRLDAPLVGRDRESRALDEVLEHVVATGRSALATVVGSAGLGKTRLIGDFVDGVGRRAAVAQGRCVSYGQGITFFPVVQVIRSALRLVGGESPEVVRHALSETMGDAPDTDHVADLLLPLLGASDAPGSHERTFWAVRRLLEELARSRPLVLVLDDLHWAEPTLLELLELVRAEITDLPLLLVCGARPELLEEHPGWGEGSRLVALDPFDGHQTRQRMEAMLGAGVPDSLVAAVTDWSGGNPLFVEEIVAHLLEEGKIEQGEEGWELGGDPSGVRMPPTVSALLAARLDRLPGPERELLQRASVIGLSFTTAEATTLAGGAADVPHTLTSLARRDLLHPVAAETESWSFRHITIRDAAYDALPKSLRAELHERFAGVLAGTSAEARETGAESLAFVAHHREQALRLRRELSPHDPGLTAQAARAVETLLEAAEAALARDDAAAARSLLASADELRHPSARGRRDVLVSRLRANAETYITRDAGVLVQRLAEETDATADDLDVATLELEQLTHRLNSSEDVEPELVVETAERVERLATAAGDAARLERALTALVTGHTMLARWSGASTVAERMASSESQAARRVASSIRAAILLHGNVPLSQAEEYVGGVAVTPAERRWLAMHRAIALAATDAPPDHPLIEDAVAAAAEVPGDMVLATEIATIHHLHGDLPRAIAGYRRAIELQREHGDLAMASTYLGVTATLLLETGGDLAEVRDLLREAEGYTSAYDIASIAFNHQIACVLAARSGDLDGARRHAEAGLAAVDRTEQLWAAADLRRHCAEWARRAGDAETERRLLTEAQALFERKEIAYWAEVCRRRLAELD